MLQQYNFDTNTTEAQADVSEEATDTDELKEEAAVEPQAEAKIDADDQSDQPEEEGVKSATDSSPIEEEEDEEPEKELEEPPTKTSSKSRKKHIIQKEDDEPTEEPHIPVLFRKGKEQVITPPASDDKAEQIDAELEAAVAKVTRTPIETKQLLDIIVAITVEGYAAKAPVPAPSQQTPTKHILTSPKGPNKRKWGTSGVVAAGHTLEQKMTRSVSFRQAAQTATPPTSPLQKKKKTLSTASPEESREERLRSTSKKR